MFQYQTQQAETKDLGEGNLESIQEKNDSHNKQDVFEVVEKQETEYVVTGLTVKNEHKRDEFELKMRVPRQSYKLKSILHEKPTFKDSQWTLFI